MPIVTTARSLAITLFLLLAPFTQAAPEKNGDPLQQLLALSGFTDQIEQLPHVMQSSIARIYEMELCDETSFNIITASIKRTFSPQQLNQMVHDDLGKKIPAATMEDMLAWYRSPLGKKITALEIASSQPEAYPLMKQASDRLFADPKRVEMARQIDALAKGTDWAVNIELQAKIAMLSALAQIQHKNITPSLIQLATQLDQQKREMRPHIEKAITLWYLYTYQDLDEKEIRTYMEFLQTNTAQTFNRMALGSLSSAITVVIENFLIDIRETGTNATSTSSEE